MTKVVSQLKHKYDKKIVSILGTDYTVLLRTPKEDPALTNLCGYCSYNSHEIVINCDMYYYKDKKDNWIKNDMKEVLRHEIFHAYFNESGLMQCACQFDGAWPKNEELIDWLALQSPKVFKTFDELELIDREVT